MQFFTIYQWCQCCLLLSLFIVVVEGFVIPTDGRVAGMRRPSSCSSFSSTITATVTRLYQSAPNKKQTNILVDEEEAPAGIGGAQFFGGNKQKEEFYDETAERTVALEYMSNTTITTHDRFQDSSVFESDFVATISKSLQSQINAVLYYGASEPSLDYIYTPGKLDWTSPLPRIEAATPLLELEQRALSFYKYVDLAIVSGQEISKNQVELQWELSVVWPTFWAPRVILLGSSTLTLNDQNEIVAQVDKVIDNGGDLLGMIGRQILPRFWDWYHIGMSPSAELLPKLNRQEPLWPSYQTYDIPARWMVQPTVMETGDREDRTAQFIPNHAFSCIIKTMGPTRQRYVTTSPVEVQIQPQDDGQLQLAWTIPLAVEFQSRLGWLLPGQDDEAVEGSEPDCQYVFQPRRKVATVPFGGDAQDAEVSEIRKKLYEQVIKDGWKPKLDGNGRPVFFFLQNSAKACYTDEGLGMCVYEWRPKISKPNEVGIELEFQENKVVTTSSSNCSP